MILGVAIAEETIDQVGRDSGETLVLHYLDLSEGTESRSATLRAFAPFGRLEARRTVHTWRLDKARLSQLSVLAENATRYLSQEVLDRLAHLVLASADNGECAMVLIYKMPSSNRVLRMPLWISGASPRANEAHVPCHLSAVVMLLNEVRRISIEEGKPSSDDPTRLLSARYGAELEAMLASDAAYPGRILASTICRAFSVTCGLSLAVPDVVGIRGALRAAPFAPIHTWFHAAIEGLTHSATEVRSDAIRALRLVDMPREYHIKALPALSRALEVETDPECAVEISWALLDSDAKLTEEVGSEQTTYRSRLRDWIRERLESRDSESLRIACAVDQDLGLLLDKRLLADLAQSGEDKATVWPRATLALLGDESYLGDLVRVVLDAQVSVGSRRNVLRLLLAAFRGVESAAMRDSLVEVMRLGEPSIRAYAASILESTCDLPVRLDDPMSAEEWASRVAIVVREWPRWKPQLRWDQSSARFVRD